MTVTTTSGWVAASWAITPPDRVSEPVSLSGAPMAATSNPSLSGTPSIAAAPGRAGHDHAGHHPDRSDGDRLGPGVAQLVDELLDTRSVDRAVDRDRDPGSGDRIEPGVGADPLQIGADLVDRDVATRAVLDERRQLPVERGRFRTQVIVAVVEVGHQDGQVLRGQLGKARVASLRSELDDDEQPERERHRRDRQLASSSAHAQPPGTLLGVTDGPADGDASGRE